MNYTKKELFAENTTYKAIERGSNRLYGDDTFLIQIVDNELPFPQPSKPFHRTAQFRFDDSDDGLGISIEQAKAIIRVITYCIDNGKNLCVQCVAGLCRSGAVVEVASLLGFKPTIDDRMPNMRVKEMLIMLLLDMGYDLSTR